MQKNNLLSADGAPPLNPYGDELRSVKVGFGSDVSSQRLSPFEIDILRRAARRRPFQGSSSEPGIAFDLFSGHFAANAVRLARLGYTAYAADFSSPDNSLDAILGRKLPSRGSVHYLCGDVRNLSFDFLAGKLDLVSGQRGLHFLRFAEAQALITSLVVQLKLGGLLFLSIGAVDCKVGAGYAHSDLPVEERWHPLALELGAPIHVTEPLCLYKREDIDLLFAELSGRLVRVEQDDFGLFVIEFEKTKT